DNRIVLDLLADVLQQLNTLLSRAPLYAQVASTVERLRKEEELADDQIRKVLPEMRALFAAAGRYARNLFIFLDDFHVVDMSSQPKLLGFLYSISRGNNVFLKLSAI